MSDNIIFSDGTVFNPPENPLKEKWNKLYPPIPRPNWSQVCDGYSCMWCERCPNGDGWRVPEEDKEEYEKYKKEFNEYCNSHGGLLNAIVKINLINLDLKGEVNENYRI